MQAPPAINFRVGLCQYPPVSLLSGFLGSGKTTLLRHALEHARLSNTLVIGNGFGEVAIDYLIVADLAENIHSEGN